MIDSEYVLTAAHCVCFKNTADLKYGPNSLILALGIHQRNENLNAFNLYRVSAVIVHPGYSQSNFLYGIITNDVALIKLSRKVESSNTSSPICLPTSKDPSVIYNKQVVMTGW